MRDSSASRNPLELDDFTLVRQMLAGEEAAFDLFFESYFPVLFRFTLGRVRDHDVARDLVQKTLAQAIEKIHQFRRESSLASWVYTICRNEISAHFRRVKRMPPPVDLVEEVAEIRRALDTHGVSFDAPEKALRRKELARQVHGVLDQLPPRQGLALEWKYLEGLSVKEIAQRLQVGPKAAESVLSRARKSFLEVFSSFGSRSLKILQPLRAPQTKAVSHE